MGDRLNGAYVNEIATFSQGEKQKGLWERDWRYNTYDNEGKNNTTISFA